MASTKASTGQDTSNGPRPLHIRSHSLASERTLSCSLLSPPYTASPEPAFIAASAASQIVTNDHDHHADTWFEQYGLEPSGETAVVTPGALKLVNGFLDQLLFSFIAASKSTSLTALRPAVVEILKPKLAKDAITGADQELHDYLGTGDDEELLASHNDVGAIADSDPETVWKRTRLRCMVYSSLGDMEEEDEDYHMEQQQLNESPISRFANDSFAVSPAVAIFLTSILEFMGEQALVFAGQQAYHRLRAKREKDGSGPSTPLEMAERVVVEEYDMDKVALDRTLGRLWRGWRKRLRSPTSSTISRSDHSRSNSLNMRTPVDRDARRPSILEVIDQDFAATIPLPISVDDVREIEIPGLAYSSDDETPVEEKKKKRPKSMMLFAPQWKIPLTPDGSAPETPISKFKEPRKRSNSLPTPLPSPIDKLFQGQDESGIDSAVAVNEHVEYPEKDQESKNQSATNHHEALEASVPVPLIRGVEQPPATKEDLAVKINYSTDANVEDSTAEDRPMSKDSDIVEQYFVQRPKIITSHRVSISGISPNSPLSPRPTSVRSLSVHSIKLIDVPSRSPARAYHGSSETTTPTSRSPAASPLPQIRSNSSTKIERSSSESIAEVAEPDSTVAAIKVVVVSKPKSRDPDESVTPTQGVMQAPAAPTSVETRPTFVLAPAPRTQNWISNGNVPDIPPRDIHRDALMVAKGPDSGVPPLTPLREMMETAADTSDEASSIAPSSRSVSETHLKGHTPNLSVASLGQAHRNEQHRRHAPTERPSYRARKDSFQKTPSEAVNRSKRSTSQSSSATSHSTRVKAMRKSLDYGEDGKGKSFEELIRSDETIQYTLTPQTMREIESPRAANFPLNVHGGSSTGSTPPRPTTAKSHKSHGSVNKYTGLHSNPPAAPPAPKSFTPVTRTVSNNTTRSRPGAPQARDPRIEHESVGDFADFIRSTGPPGLSRPPRSSPVTNGRGAPKGLTRHASTSFSQSGGTTPIRRSESSAGRTRLMARDAVVPHNDNNSDLIDFIRQGPPSENPRIPRTVAPFRTTMDSDQMAGAVGGRAFELILPDARVSRSSTNVSESMHSSVNSQSALLNGTNLRTIAPARSYNDFDQEDMMPKRKTRRVRDPYAIDFSDEEEDELFAMPTKKPQREEESLIDFLNNVPPPPSAVASEPPKAKGHIKKKPSRGLMSRFTRTNSNTNITSNPSPSSYSANPNYPRASTGSRPASNHPQLPSQSSFSNCTGTAHSTVSTIKETPRSYASASAHQSSHPPHYQDDKPKSYQPARGNYISQLDTERKPPSTAGTNGTRVTQRTYQPREAREASEGTDDLAAFLMASAPPPSMAREAPPEPFLLSQNHGSGGGGSFSRMFRKKGRA